MKLPIQYLYDKARKSETIMGSEPKFERHSIMTGHDVKTKRKLLSGIDQEALDIQNHPMYQQALQFLNGIYGQDQASMDAFNAPYMRQFNEQIVPGLAERFTAAGGQDSSGFQQTLGQAGAGLMENLAALRGNMQMQSLPFLQNMYQQPFQNTLTRAGLGLGAQKYAFGNVPGQAGLLQYAAQGLGQAGGMAARGMGGGAF